MFHRDPRFARELDRYEDDDGVVVVVTLETGTHNWNSSREPEPAIRVRVDRDGHYDPISSSIVPLGYWGDLNGLVSEIACRYLAGRGARSELTPAPA